MQLCYNMFQETQLSQSQPSLIIDTQKQSSQSSQPSTETDKEPKSSVESSVESSTPNREVQKTDSVDLDEPIFSPYYTAPPSVQAVGPIIEAPPSVAPPTPAADSETTAAEPESDAMISITDVRSVDMPVNDENFIASDTDKHLGQYKFPNGARIVTMYRDGQLYCASHELVIKLRLGIASLTQIRCTPEEGARIRSMGRSHLKENFEFKLVPLEEVKKLLEAKNEEPKKNPLSGFNIGTGTFGSTSKRSDIASNTGHNALDRRDSLPVQTKVSTSLTALTGKPGLKPSKSNPDMSNALRQNIAASGQPQVSGIDIPNFNTHLSPVTKPETTNQVITSPKTQHPVIAGTLSATAGINKSPVVSSKVSSEATPEKTTPLTSGDLITTICGPMSTSQSANAVLTPENIKHGSKTTSPSVTSITKNTGTVGQSGNNMRSPTTITNVKLSEHQKAQLLKNHVNDIIKAALTAASISTAPTTTASVTPVTGAVTQTPNSMAAGVTNTTKSMTAGVMKTTNSMTAGVTPVTGVVTQTNNSTFGATTSVMATATSSTTLVTTSAGVSSSSTQSITTLSSTSEASASLAKPADDNAISCKASGAAVSNTTTSTDNGNVSPDVIFVGETISPKKTPSSSGESLSVV